MIMVIIVLCIFIAILIIYIIQENANIRTQKNDDISEMKKIISDMTAQNNSLIELIKDVPNLHRKLIDLEDQISDWKDGIQVTDEFIRVRDLIKHGEQMIFVHGGAGVGKSTLIRWLEKKGCIKIKLAPTGLAALNIEGSTIHKFFGFKPVSIFFKTLPANSIPRDTERVLSFCNTIVIDEVSMVRSDMIDMIDRTLRKAREKMHNSGYLSNHKPFGGFQMIFIGDMYQLPPVVDRPSAKFFKSLDSTCDLRNGWESPWFLDAEVFKKKKPEVVHLTKVFRQNEKNFVNLLNDLRKYQNIPEHLNKINDSSFSRDIDNGTCIVLNNRQADQINYEKISKINSPAVQFDAQVSGIFLEYLKDNDKKNLPVPDKLILKEKADVMILYNDPNGFFVNGSSGKVLELTDRKAIVRLVSGKDVEIGFHTWESYRIVWNEEKKCFENEVDGTYTQMPLIPSYAITCHKSQGKTLNRANIIFAGNAFCSGQTYVALSRVRNFCDFTISGCLTVADFIQDTRLQYFEQNGWI